MKKIKILSHYHRSHILSCALVAIFLGFMNSLAFGSEQVGLYDVFETQIINHKTYLNRFDFTVIELQATFTAPSGRQINFFGFYDGDGNGGQTGYVWKLRFMPHELGIWDYTYTWTDGTPGGLGNFEVVDTGLPGPLKEATDNPWYFMTARNEPFDFRGNSLGWTPRFAPSRDITKEVAWIKNAIQAYIINNGYNFTDWGGLINRGQIPNETNNWAQSWWLNNTDKKRFNIAAWHAYEGVLDFLKDNKIYASSYSAFVYQGYQYEYNDFKVFLRYYMARLGAYYNLLGFGPTWEVNDVYSVSEVNQIMQYVYDIDPWKRPHGVHDSMRSEYENWGGVSLRQRQSRTVFDGNCRTCGKGGGIQAPFDNKPIIGSEDIWERPNGAFAQPRNATEVRRAAWGLQLAGILTIYSEWNDADELVTPGTGQGEAEVRRMFDFVYSKTRYRQYQQLNHLVSSSERQIASGIPGEEYLVYDEDGGSITIDLSGTSPSDTFSVHWFDPKTGVEQNSWSINGGTSRTLASPFSEDSVLLLVRKSVTRLDIDLKVKDLKDETGTVDEVKDMINSYMEIP